MIDLLANLLILFGISLGINLVVFHIAFFGKTDKLTDITYSLTFISILLYAFLINIQTKTGYSAEYWVPVSILFILVLVWSIRIGAFLLKRIALFKVDHRFDKMRSSYFRFMGFWVLQGISVYIIMFPILFLMVYHNDSYLLSYRFEFYSIIGIVLAIAGILFETIGDQQKLVFKRNKQPGFIQTGVWKYSRHPNYLGEILMWVGSLIIVLVQLVLNSTNNYLFVLLIIPGLYIPLLLNLVSGVPLLEINTYKKIGESKEYISYMNKTPILVPFIGSKGIYLGRFHLVRRLFKKISN